MLLSVFGGLFVFYIAYFSWLFTTSTFDSIANLYSNTYGIIPLIGGLYGIYISPRWGGFKSAVGRAVFFLSLGLVTWGCGIMIWLYYNIVVGIAVPYPSLADAAFFVSWPLWGIGAAYLSLATGARFALKEMRGRIMLFIAPLVIIAFSYFALVSFARGGLISTFDDAVKAFFDLAYPIGDVVILSIAVLIFGLSYQYFGGIYKRPIFLILGGFVMNYAADFTFSYTTTLETYYNGSLADVLFMTTMSLLSIGIVLMDPGSEETQTSTGSVFTRIVSFDQMVTSIVKEQEQIIGPLAWTEAGKVQGLAVNRAKGEVAIADPDPKGVVDRLVARYESLFGGASLQVCREATAAIISTMPRTDVPSSLLAA